MVPSGSVTPLVDLNAVGADEVAGSGTGETVAVSKTSTEVEAASEVATTIPGEDIGIITETAVVLTAAPLEEVARMASGAELDLVLALHADFLDVVMVELEKWVKLEDGPAITVTAPAALEAVDEAALVTTALELLATKVTAAEVAAVAVAETAPVWEALIPPE